MKFLTFIFIVMFSFNAWALKLESDSFGDKEYIEAKYTCDSIDISPALYWNDAPANTESFVLICDDPDAPFNRWTHWVVFNIPKDVNKLEENFSKDKTLDLGIIQGMNDFGKPGYGGPCPPEGKPHRYFFKLYALDTKLSLGETATKKDVDQAIQGHILAETNVMGLYKR